MQQCENASNAGKCSFSDTFFVDTKVMQRQDYCNEKMRDLLKEGLADLGLQRCEVQYKGCGPGEDFYYRHMFHMSATWTADAETSRKGESIVTRPISPEHRPAGALVPCGQVVCSPMCRKVITLATQGLFMALVGWIFLFVWMRGSFPVAGGCASPLDLGDIWLWPFRDGCQMLPSYATVSGTIVLDP